MVGFLGFIWFALTPSLSRSHLLPTALQLWAGEGALWLAV